MRVETPSVLLIYTGGTIGMIENPETGALENFNFDHLLKHVPELKRFNYRISSYQFEPPLDSSDMEPACLLYTSPVIPTTAGRKSHSPNHSR